MRYHLVLLLGLAVFFIAAACGDDDDAPQDGLSTGVGPGISVSDALASDLPGPLLVNGFIVARGDNVRLCSALAESFPPQCAQESLKVDGLDLASVEGLKTEQDVSGSDDQRQILGEVEGDVLRISLTSR